MVALATPPQIGNIAAAICVTKLRKAFDNLQQVIVCGIAGGIPKQGDDQDNLFLGDVVVLNEHGLFHYDYGRLKIRPPESSALPNWLARFLARGSSRLDYFLEPKNESTLPVDDLFLNISHDLDIFDRRGESLWLKRLDERLPVLIGQDPETRRPPLGPQKFESTEGGRLKPTHRTPRRDSPRAFRGAIASGNCVLRHPFIRDELRDRMPPVLAVEMEAAGAAQACKTLALKYTVVRGICDYCDGTKEKSWQSYAAAVAAAYAYCVIQHLPASTAQPAVRARPEGFVQDNRDVERAAMTAVASGAISADSLTNLPPTFAESKAPREKTTATPAGPKTGAGELQLALQAHLSEMLRFEAQHDWRSLFHSAEKTEQRTNEAISSLPQDFVAEVFYQVARAYLSWAKLAPARQKELEARAAALTKKALEMTP